MVTAEPGKPKFFGAQAKAISILLQLIFLLKISLDISTTINLLFESLLDGILNPSSLNSSPLIVSLEQM